MEKSFEEMFTELCLRATGRAIYHRDYEVKEVVQKTAAIRNIRSILRTGSASVVVPEKQGVVQNNVQKAPRPEKLVKSVFEISKNKNWKYSGRPVHQYGPDGKFIKTHEDIVHAVVDILHITENNKKLHNASFNIARCCNSKKSSCLGYYWRYDKVDRVKPNKNACGIGHSSSYREKYIQNAQQQEGAVVNA